MRWLVPFVLVATVLAGCGDDDDAPDETTTTTTTTDAATDAAGTYVERMEAACDERDVAIEEVVTPIPDNQDAAYMDSVVRGSVPVIRDYLAAVEAIGPPGGDLDDEHAEYVELLRDLLARYEEAVESGTAPDIFGRPAPDFRRLETALGLETCGTPGNGKEPAES